MNRKRLYESIMKDVSKTVKKHLNETESFRRNYNIDFCKAIKAAINDTIENNSTLFDDKSSMMDFIHSIFPKHLNVLSYGKTWENALAACLAGILIEAVGDHCTLVILNNMDYAATSLSVMIDVVEKHTNNDNILQACKNLSNNSKVFEKAKQLFSALVEDSSKIKIFKINDEDEIPTYVMAGDDGIFHEI